MENYYMIFDIDSDEIGIATHKSMKSTFHQGNLPFSPAATPPKNTDSSSNSGKDERWLFNPDNETAYIIQIIVASLIVVAGVGFLVWNYFIKD